MLEWKESNHYFNVLYFCVKSKKRKVLTEDYGYIANNDCNDNNKKKVQ